jgi:uncharacterized protein (TIGR00297 family)
MRKAVHISMGGFALALRYLTWPQAAALAVVALLHNLFVLPRTSGRRLERDHDLHRGFALGIILYPTTVLLLILAFRDRLEVAAAMWGMLAVGDGLAGIVGKRFGRARLPWNPGKSWAGSAAYALGGGAAASALFAFTLGRYPEVPYPSLLWAAVAAPILVAVFGAFLESVDTGLDDNLTAPLLGGLLLWGLAPGDPGRLLEAPHPRHLLWAVLVNLALAAAALATKGVGTSGAVSGFLLGTTIFACLGPAGFLLLFVFFVLGTVVTKMGYRVKLARGIAQERGGRRGARNALANVGAPACLALMAALATDAGWGRVLAVGFAAAFATALSDTAASEVGKLWGRTTVLITTFRRVPRGTEGAVSLEGTAAGFVGSGLVAASAAPLLGGRWDLVAVVAAAGFAGMLLESLLGAGLDAMKAADNDFMNFLNTVMGASLAIAAALLLPLPGGAP